MLFYFYDFIIQEHILLRFTFFNIKCVYENTALFPFSNLYQKGLDLNKNHIQKILEHTVIG